jgi:hypothetical protein
MLGLGGAAVAGAAILPGHADAARRGFSGPTFPTPCVPNCNGTTCGADGCGGACTCPPRFGCDRVLGDLCVVPCDDSSQCGSDCHCDPGNLVCASNQLGSSCSGAFDCPTGTYCEDRGSEGSNCVAPCAEL